MFNYMGPSNPSQGPLAGTLPSGVPGTVPAGIPGAGNVGSITPTSTILPSRPVIPPSAAILPQSPSMTPPAPTEPPGPGDSKYVVKTQSDGTLVLYEHTPKGLIAVKVLPALKKFDHPDQRK